MSDTKLSTEFIAKAVHLASESKSGYNILLLWKEADTQEFKNRVVMLFQKFFDDLEDFKATKTYEVDCKKLKKKNVSQNKNFKG